MTRRLLAAAIALAVMFSTGACTEGGQQAVANPTTTSTRTTNPTGSATPSASATASASTSASAPPPAPGSSTSQGNQPQTTPTTPTPARSSPPPPPPQDPNAAFCETAEAIFDLSFELIPPGVILENSADPAEIEQAWQDIHFIAVQGAALSRQAIDQTNDAYAKTVVQSMATYFDRIAAAAATRDLAALDSISELVIPEPPSGTQPPCQF